MVEKPRGSKAASSTAAPSVPDVSSILSRYETFTADVRSEAGIVRAATEKLGVATDKVGAQMVSVANSMEKLTMLVTAVRTEGVKTSSMLNSVPGLIDSKLEASQATTDFQLMISELAAALKGSLVDITEQLGQTIVSTAAPATNISSAGPSQLPASFAAAAACPKPVTHRPAPFLHASASPALHVAVTPTQA